MPVAARLGVQQEQDRGRRAAPAVPRGVAPGLAEMPAFGMGAQVQRPDDGRRVQGGTGQRNQVCGTVAATAGFWLIASNQAASFGRVGRQGSCGKRKSR